MWHLDMQVRELQGTISGLQAAAEQGRDTTAAELAEVRRQLSEVTGQLTEAQRQQARAAAKAEEQASRADKWESECIGACIHPHHSSANLEGCKFFLHPNSTDHLPKERLKCTAMQHAEVFSRLLYTSQTH